jgi:transketolase N-terminal domain/subunit
VWRARARAFGWHAIELDGHDMAAIDRAYAEASELKPRSSPGTRIALFLTLFIHFIVHPRV